MKREMFFKFLLFASIGINLLILKSCYGHEGTHTCPKITCPKLKVERIDCPGISCPEVVCPELILPEMPACPVLKCPELKCPEVTYKQPTTTPQTQTEPETKPPTVEELEGAQEGETIPKEPEDEQPNKTIQDLEEMFQN